MKTTEAIMEILAAYDLTQSYRDAAALVGCAPNTVARYVLARDAGGLRTTPAQRNQLMDPFRDKIVARKFELKKGYFDVPTGPGLGIEIDESVVKKYVKK